LLIKYRIYTFYVLSWDFLVHFWGDPRILSTLGVECMLRLGVVSLYDSTLKSRLDWNTDIFLTCSLFNASSSIVCNRLFYNLVVRFYIIFLPYLITLVYFLIYYLNHKMLIKKLSSVSYLLNIFDLFTNLFTMTRHITASSI
jgi:hypothetical protein